MVPLWGGGASVALMELVLEGLWRVEGLAGEHFLSVRHVVTMTSTLRKMELELIFSNTHEIALA
jgi:hypothetical protein